MINKYYVYFHYKLSTGELFHIGYGSNDRAFDVRGRNVYWKRIVKMYGYVARIEFYDMSRIEALNLERKLINKYRPRTNIHVGGCGGDTWSRLSVYRKNKVKKKMQKLNKGKNHPQYGNRKTEETISKIKNSEFHRKVSKPIVCITTGKKFVSIAETAAYYKINKANLRRLLKSKTRKFLKNLKFKYII